MLPDPLPGDIERARWKNVPHDLAGRVVSLNQLEHSFPEDGEHGPIGLLEDMEHHSENGRKRKGTHPYGIHVAYECKACRKITIGSPRIVDDTSLNAPGTPPLCGREGYDVYCGQCNHQFEEHIWAAS